MERGDGWQTAVTPDLIEFLAGLDMFYVGTASADGQPYIQYRGGPPGFLKALQENTLAFADFGGNRPYITVGNLSENPKAFLLLMDYANRQRVKLWGNAKAVEDDPALQVGAGGRVHRRGRDVNCPQPIHRRFPEQQVTPMVEQFQRHARELEEQLKQAREAGQVSKG